MKKLLVILLSVACTTFAFGQKKEIKSVGEIDVNKLGGKWYVLSRLPNPIDKDKSNVNVTYFPEGKKVKETLKLTNKKGKEKTIKATNKYKGNGNLKGPLGGSYVIAQMGDNYFVMATKNGKHMWINCREKTMDNATYNMIVSKAGTQGFDISKLEKIPQN